MHSFEDESLYFTWEHLGDSIKEITEDNGHVPDKEVERVRVAAKQLRRKLLCLEGRSGEKREKDEWQ